MQGIDQPMFAMFEFAPGFCAGQSSSAIEILLIQAGDEGATVSTTIDGKATTESFEPGWSGLLVLDRVACEVTDGDGKYCVADMAMMAKLQAFLDAGLEPSDATEAAAFNRSNAADAANAAHAAPRLIALPVAILPSMHCARTLERCFLMQACDPDPDFSRISAALRLTEWYKLVRFLLTQPATMTMQALSERYGLSYSHFRRLCRQAFGRGGKAEFQQWRNVRALLDMVDSGASMTEVALRQGFASSSHFSDAMKGQFGMPPRRLTRPLSKNNDDL
ncbi:MAG: invF [Herbaspirillum sp.]|nr:invF [Herbaspirillum sp.]